MNQDKDVIEAGNKRKVCLNHKPLSENFGYVGWQEECERRKKLGMKQKQCSRCLKWFYKDEF